ncbi:hypothetical protein AVEN_166482-1 [Araneus ventricosus]|uniref:Uncharacterized protein n=1 Tax=Araneus ventricosus TaxID=182803 RepID=A0A4Y2JI88_ARAVE|nr:hypothetical protein AVEN_166482-1 [Araneus ventricosus]
MYTCPKSISAREELAESARKSVVHPDSRVLRHDMARFGLLRTENNTSLNRGKFKVFFLAIRMIPVKPGKLQHRLFPQIQQARDDFIFMQDGALPHFQHEVRQYLKDAFVVRWIGKVGNMILLILSGFRGHHILHLANFNCVGIKDSEYCNPYAWHSSRSARSN